MWRVMWSTYRLSFHSWDWRTWGRAMLRVRHDAVQKTGQAWVDCPDTEMDRLGRWGYLAQLKVSALPDLEELLEVTSHCTRGPWLHYDYWCYHHCCYYYCCSDPFGGDAEILRREGSPPWTERISKILCLWWEAVSDYCSIRLLCPSLYLIWVHHLWGIVTIHQLDFPTEAANLITFL